MRRTTVKERILALRKSLDPHGKLDNWTGYLFDQAFYAGRRDAIRCLNHLKRKRAK